MLSPHVTKLAVRAVLQNTEFELPRKGACKSTETTNMPSHKLSPTKSAQDESLYSLQVGEFTPPTARQDLATHRWGCVDEKACALLHKLPVLKDDFLIG